MIDQRQDQEPFEAYWREGFQVISDLFQPREVREWDLECERLWKHPSVTDGDPSRVQVRRHAKQSTIRDRIDPVIDISLVFRGLSEDERLLAVARAILESDVAVMKDRLITKRPGTHGYGLHQDFPYWESSGVPADKILSAMVSIDAADEENGAIEVFPRVHDRRFPGPPEEPRDVDERCLDGFPSHVVHTDPGDVLLMHSLTPHRSAPNRSGRLRRMVAFIYVPARYARARELYYTLRA